MGKREFELPRIMYHYGIRNIPILGIGVATMVHDYGHLICSWCLGFQGIIKSERMSSVYPISCQLDLHWTLFYLSGGIMQFVVFWLMSVMESDANSRIANRMTAIIGLIEGVTEPIRIFRLSGLGASLGIIASFTYLAINVAWHRKE